MFVSYRREGTSAHAGRLYDFLKRGVDDQPGFAKEQIFMDIDRIRPGEDFRKTIREAVMRCDVLLAVIGKQWASAEDAKGRRRLDNPADYVRLEIEAALDRDIPVIPVLVDSAEMPGESELPDSLSALAYRHAVELSHTRWSFDVRGLLASLKGLERERHPQTSPPQSQDQRPGKQAGASKPTSPRSAQTRTTAKPKGQSTAKPKRKTTTARRPATHSSTSTTPKSKSPPKRNPQTAPARTQAEARVLRHLDQAGLFEAGEKTVATCPYSDAFAARELTGKRQIQFRGGHVVITNKRILLISEKKVVLEFALATFEWVELEPLDAVSRAQIELGRRKNQPGDLTIWIFNFKRGEGLHRALAAQVAKAQTQRRTPTRQPTATRAARKSAAAKPAAKEPASPPGASPLERPMRQSGLSGSIADPLSAAWDTFIANHREGDILEGTVNLIFSDSANVLIVKGIAAQLPGTPMHDPMSPPASLGVANSLKTSEGIVVKVGQTVRVRVVKLDRTATWLPTGQLIVALEPRRRLFGSRS